MKRSFILSGVVFILTMGASQPSYALTTGCDQTKYDSLKNVSEVRRAYDVGATQEIIPKPDSILDLTCFSQASQISAQNGGAIFSGDFKTNLNNVIEVPTSNISDNFDGGLMRENGLPKDAGWGSAAYGCDNMKNVWTASQSSGVDNDATFMDMDAILAASVAPPPGSAIAPGNIMEYNLTNPAVAASSAAVNATLRALPTPIPVMDGDINGNGRLDSCDVLRNLAGGPVAGC